MNLTPEAAVVAEAVVPEGELLPVETAVIEEVRTAPQERKGLTLPAPAVALAALAAGETPEEATAAGAVPWEA